MKSFSLARQEEKKKFQDSQGSSHWIIISNVVGRISRMKMKSEILSSSLTLVTTVSVIEIIFQSSHKKFCESAECHFSVIDDKVHSAS